MRNQTSKKKYLLQLIERRSKVHEKNISREQASKFEQSTVFSENYKANKSMIMVFLQNY